MSEAEKPSAAELALLRGFYVAWTEFHSIPRTNIHRNRKEAAAQMMVDAHHSLQLFYEHHARPQIALATVDGQHVGGSRETVVLPDVVRELSAPPQIEAIESGASPVPPPEGIIHAGA